MLEQKKLISVQREDMCLFSYLEIRVNPHPLNFIVYTFIYGSQTETFTGVLLRSTSYSCVFQAGQQSYLDVPICAEKDKEE